MIEGPELDETAICPKISLFRDSSKKGNDLVPTLALLTCHVTEL
jgi:hypothetical protein